jgi:TetR/AcrR family transcriptional repressor of lmrAB and yxaGH operons
MASTRDRIIETMCDLLEPRGYHATGLNQVETASGAPKGSLYHDFPDGKDGSTAGAIARGNWLPVVLGEASPAMPTPPSPSRRSSRRSSRCSRIRWKRPGIARAGR